jgi:hypothetical protein
MCPASFCPWALTDNGSWQITGPDRFPKAKGPGRILQAMGPDRFLKEMGPDRLFLALCTVRKFISWALIEFLKTSPFRYTVLGVGPDRFLLAADLTNTLGSGIWQILMPWGPDRFFWHALFDHFYENSGIYSWRREPFAHRSWIFRI